MELYIVRHGETDWNATKLLQGRSDIDLNENGRHAAIKLGDALDEQQITFDVIYSSPLIRAYETACLIRGRKSTAIIRDQRLIELCFGIQEGLPYSSWPESKHFFHQPELYIPARNAETLDELKLRARSFIQEVIEPQYCSAKRILIVAHGALNKGIMSYLEDLDTAHFWGERLQKNCEAAVFSYDGKKWKPL